MFPIYFMLSLPEALDAYRGLMETNEEFPEFWNKDWLPIFESGSADNLAISCTQSPVEDAEIVCHHNEIGDFPIYVSLEGLLRTVPEHLWNQGFSMRLRIRGQQ